MRFLLAAMMLWASAALAQHNHAQGHSEYQDWRSIRAPHSCCNEQDCGSAADTDVRETATGAQVRISGTWCPVLREHYLTRGKSPSWETAHVCVQPISPYNVADPCGRLLCFISKGGF